MTREAWTDERLDDLNGRVNEGFARVDARFDKVDARFDKVDDRFNDVRAEIIGVRESVEMRLDALYRTMAYALVGLAGILVTGLLGIFGLLV